MSEAAAVPVDVVIANNELMRRPPRAPDYRAEAAALGDLAAVLSRNPQAIVQTLVDKALTLLHAGSAGLSLFDVQGDERIFRWKATAGEFARYHNGTMPRDFSPCGEVCKRDAPLLMRGMVRAYPYVSGLHAPVVEALLVPFHRDGAPIGTLWVVHHNDTDHFTAEDLRVLERLTEFAALAAQTSLQVADLRAENATQRRELAASAASNAALAEADRNKDDFLATLGHELRNPLNPLSISLHLLRARTAADDAEGQRLLAVMERQTRQLKNLTDGLMEGAEIRSGKLTLRMGVLTLQGLVAGAIEHATPRLEERDQRLAVEVPEQAVKFTGDETRLLQALSNLLGNAGKYSPPGSLVRLTGALEDEAVVLNVIDSGIGIAVGDNARIFEMFSQVPASSSMYCGGLGIGLALVKQVVELHGGRVTAHSAGVGHGSRFEVRLPATGGMAVPGL